MTLAAHLAGVLVVSQLAVWALARARWTWLNPRTSIVTWQAVGLAWALGAVGIPLAIGLERYPVGPLRALPLFVADLVRGTAPAPARLAAIGVGLALGILFTATHVTSVLAAVRARARHRAVLALVARRDEAVPGALVLDHPAAAAYCLPGLRATVVVSAGTLSLLDRAELAAVLSHERAHANERHDLVLLPFTALCRALPWLRWPARAYDAVSLLIEMRADDRALRQNQAGPLATALLRFAAGTPGTGPGLRAPTGALGLADRHLTARIERIERLRQPVRASRRTANAFLFSATALLTVGVCLLT